MPLNFHLDRRWTIGRPMILCAWVATGLFAAGTVSAAGVAHHIAAANLVVTQNDTGNTAASVTVTPALAINDFRVRSGSNRADYNVQIGAQSTDDVTNGILISSIDQNGRDNGETNFPGQNYGSSAVDSNASGSPGSSGEYWIPVFQAPANAEYNFNVAAAWFPYNDGWYGGWLNNDGGVNGGANNHLIGNTNLVVGTHVIDLGGGKTTVNLLPFGLDARSNAVLLAVGGKNEANFALTGANSNGTWTVYCHDDNGGAEQDYVAFVAVPLTNHTVVAGKFMGDARVALQSAPFFVTNTGVGTYHLVIPGVSPADGVLLVTPEGGGVNNGDNLASYQIHGDGWDIQTRDLTAGFTPALQNLPASDGVVSFVYIPGPVPGSTNLVWAGTGTNVWDLSGKLNWRFLTNSAAAAYIDGARVRLDDTAVTGQINLSTTVAPYSLWVSNTGLTYQLGGNGSLAGSMGLQKWGAGTLLLAETNFYLGDTVIGQGRVILGAVGALPGGVGAGQLTVDGILDLGGWPAVVNAPTGHGLIDNSGTATNVWLTILAGTNRTFAGMITNSQGTLSLRVSGAGGFKLTGAIGIRGEVEVTNGGLFISGSLQASQTRVTVGASLAGTGTVGGPVLFAAGSALQVEAGLPLTVVNPVLNGVVNLLVTGGYSLTNAGTYGLLNHGTINGSGSWQLAAPVGLACNGFAARLWDTGSQLQMIVYPAGVTGTIADVRHVVVLMNENRSFDHYFGTYHGTRGFDDHNAILLTNQFNAFYQPVNGGYELPFHTSLQCIGDLNHSWPVTHATVNGGRNDQWIPNKGPSTMAYMDRSDLSFYYALADAFTLCDEYHCSVLSSTYPNRLYLMTGMIDPTGSGGGPEIDNTQLANGFTWRTYPELLQQAGVSWKVYSVLDDDSDNVLQLFANFKRALPGTSLYDRGMSPAPTLSALVSAFKNDVASNALPSVSWIIGPGNYTEHPPYSPANGEWFTKQLLDAMAANPAVYTNTVFILNYDENDGFYDHAMPILAPPGTPDEYVGSQPIGLGVRVPAIMISPWSRGGRSCSQVFDHTSVIRFLEQWTGVTNQNISAWRRQVCGDLTSAFDFAHPQPDFPVLPQVYGISCSSGTVPEVPAQPTLPVQESGSVIRLPLPYQPEVTCSLDAAGGTLGLTLTNGGGAAVHFGVYANADRFDGPWPVEVAGGSGASQMFHLTGNGHYDFSAYGPDGFQRRFAGNLNLDARQIDAQAAFNGANGAGKVALINQTGAAVTFTVSNGYAPGLAQTYLVPGLMTNLISVHSETNQGLYDLWVTTGTDTNFLRRFLGRVPTATAPVALTAGQNPVALGALDAITNRLGGFGTPNGKVQFLINGIAWGGTIALDQGQAVVHLPLNNCGLNQVTAEYGGDLWNDPATNQLDIMAYARPVITLTGGDRLTNWVGTAFVDPGAAASNSCAEVLTVRVAGGVNTNVPGIYVLDYIAGTSPVSMTTNQRTVVVLPVTAPIFADPGQWLGSQYQLAFSGPAGQPFRLLMSSNLLPNAGWNPVYTGIFSAGLTGYLETNVTGSASRFYRLLSP